MPVNFGALLQEVASQPTVVRPSLSLLLTEFQSKEPETPVTTTVKEALHRDDELPRVSEPDERRPHRIASVEKIYSPRRDLIKTRYLNPERLSGVSHGLQRASTFSPIDVKRILHKRDQIEHERQILTEPYQKTVKYVKHVHDIAMSVDATKEPVKHTHWHEFAAKLSKQASMHAKRLKLHYELNPFSDRDYALRQDLNKSIKHHDDLHKLHTDLASTKTVTSASLSPLTSTIHAKQDIAEPSPISRKILTKVSGSEIERFHGLYQKGKKGTNPSTKESIQNVLEDVTLRCNMYEAFTGNLKNRKPVMIQHDTDPEDLHSPGIASKSGPSIRSPEGGASNRSAGLSARPAGVGQGRTSVGDPHAYTINMKYRNKATGTVHNIRQDFRTDNDKDKTGVRSIDRAYSNVAHLAADYTQRAQTDPSHHEIAQKLHSVASRIGVMAGIRHPMPAQYAGGVQKSAGRQAAFPPKGMIKTGAPSGNSRLQIGGANRSGASTMAGSGRRGSGATQFTSLQQIVARVRGASGRGTQAARYASQGISVVKQQRKKANRIIPPASGKNPYSGILPEPGKPSAVATQAAPAKPVAPAKIGQAQARHGVQAVPNAQLKNAPEMSDLLQHGRLSLLQAKRLHKILSTPASKMLKSGKHTAHQLRAMGAREEFQESVPVYDAARENALYSTLLAKQSEELWHKNKKSSEISPKEREELWNDARNSHKKAAEHHLEAMQTATQNLPDSSITERTAKAAYQHEHYSHYVEHHRRAHNLETERYAEIGAKFAQVVNAHQAEVGVMHTPAKVVA